MYKIRVRPAAPFPSHNGNPCTARYSGNNPTQAERVQCWLILGAPVEPSHYWKCGTDVVWPVLAVEGIPGFKLLDTAHVCRHQIQIGD